MKVIGLRNLQVGDINYEIIQYITFRSLSKAAKRDPEYLVS